MVLIQRPLGRRFKSVTKLWGKILEDVDENEQNGYAFKGEWINIEGSDYAEINDDLDVGKMIVFTEASGSTKHPDTHINLVRVKVDGELEELYRKRYVTKTEKIEAVREIARIFKNKKRDELKEILAELLKNYTKQEIINKLNEMRR